MHQADASDLRSPPDSVIGPPESGHATNKSKASAPVIRPASAEDIARFSDMPNKPSIRAWVAEDRDGNLIGMGGIFLQGGRWFGFVDVHDELRSHKMHLMRAAIRFLDAMRRDGVRYIYAEIAPKEPRARAWLESLGFEFDQRSQHFHRWSATNHG